MADIRETLNGEKKTTPGTGADVIKDKVILMNPDFIFPNTGKAGQLGIHKDFLLDDGVAVVKAIQRLVRIAHAYSIGGKLLNKEGVQVFMDISRVKAAFALELDHEVVSIAPAISSGLSLTVEVPNGLAYAVKVNLTGQNLNPVNITVKVTATSFNGVSYVADTYTYAVNAEKNTSKWLFPVHRPISELTYDVTNSEVRSDDTTRRVMVTPYDFSTSNEFDVKGRVTSTKIELSGMTDCQAVVYPLFYSSQFLRVMKVFADGDLLSAESFEALMLKILNEEI